MHTYCILAEVTLFSSEYKSAGSKSSDLKKGIMKLDITSAIVKVTKIQHKKKNKKKTMSSPGN